MVRPGADVLTAAAYALLAAALTVSDGHDQPVAVVLLLVSTLCATVAAVSARRLGAGEMSPWIALALALASAITSLSRSPGGLTASVHVDARYAVMAGGMLCVIVSYVADVRARTLITLGWRRWRPVALLVLGAGLGVWMLRASPSPAIDVWDIQQQAAKRLLVGKSVYAPGAIAVLDSHSFDHVVGSYIYPPLDILLAAGAFALTGETRFAALVAILVGAWLLRAIARRSEPAPSAVPDLLMASLLLHPRGLFVLDQAWGEPLALPFLGGFAIACLARRYGLASVLLGLLCGVKQHLLLYLPALALVPGIGLYGGLVALATVAATYAPFILWDHHGMWSALVGHHLGNPFRADSLSLTAFVSNAGIFLPAWLGFIAASAGLAVVLRMPRDLGPLLIASALPFFGFYLLGRQAFCNYYYLLDATLLFAVAAMRSHDHAHAKWPTENDKATVLARR
jgi:hypothetical protein